MRLGQLARKLSIKPSEIVEFLKQKGVEAPEHSNTRMDDDHVIQVIQKFAPDMLEKINREEDEAEPETEVIPVAEEPVNLSPEDSTSIGAVEVVTETTGTETSDTLVDKEVIRAPKIELSGLKVLGKIELPQPKVKEMGESTDSIQPTEKVESRKPKKRSNQDRKKQSGNWVNPLELKRQQEAKEAEERKRLEIERKKESRKRYYEEKVKPIKPKRIKSEKEAIEKAGVKKAEPATWVGRFLKWWRME